MFSKEGDLFLWRRFVSLGLAPALTDYRPIEGSFEAYKRGQSRIARRRLYPLAVFYAVYSLIVTLLMLSSRHPLLGDRKSTRLNSSHTVISYAVFCLKKKNRVTTYLRPD